MTDLNSKVALVTGASRGIGRACALELARRGAAVVAGYATGEEQARKVVEEVAALGGKAKALQIDVAQASSCEAAIEFAIAEFGKLDVLVNNAGITIDGLLLRYKEEDWRRQFQVNVDGAFYLCKAAARPMMKQRSGSIVNLTSVVGESGNAGQAAYAATKAALIGFTKSVARELASRNVRVNAVSPGFIDTDMTARIAGEAREQLIGSIPLGRMGGAEEVARAVAFLASDDASYITGEVLRVNGGLLT